MAPEELPPARQLVTTWWVPEQYAGQTTATLRRVGEQVQRSGRPVDVLTFSALQDSAEITERLSRRGSLPEGVTVRTLFSDLRAWDADGTLVERLRTLPHTEPSPDTGAVAAEEERSRWCVRKYDERHVLVRGEAFRSDGTVLCRDFPVRLGGKDKRHQQFYGPDGAPTVLVGSAWDVYFLWLDHLVGEGPAVITSESKSTARFLWRYDNPRATVVHVFHESHLEESQDPYKGRLQDAHGRVLPRLDRFDAAVFLTRRQRSDVAERFGDTGNLHTIPNAGPPVQPDPPRPFLARLGLRPERPDRGVVVATLKPLKRIEHAVEAIGLVERGGGRSRTFGLDVYGRDAGSRASIERTIRSTGTDRSVVLHGYTSGAGQHFAAASFSLMTSTTEGQSLVLLESMAAGCVPIAYDIRYGPDEDVMALAETISRFLSLPRGTVRAMRARARERVAAFDDDVVFRRWVEVQRAAVEARSRRIRLTSLRLPRVDLTADGGRIALDAEARITWDTTAWSAPDPLPEPTASWLLLGRHGGRPWREPLAVSASSTAEDATLRLVGPLDPRSVAVHEKVSDVHVEVTAGSSVRRVRLSGEVAVEVPGGQLYTTSHGNVSLRQG